MLNSLNKNQFKIIKLNLYLINLKLMDTIAQSFSATTVATETNQSNKSNQTDESKAYENCRNKICKFYATTQASIIVLILELLDCFTNKNFVFLKINIFEKDEEEISTAEINELFTMLNELIAKIPVDYQIKSDEERKNLKYYIGGLEKLVSMWEYDIHTDNVLQNFQLITNFKNKFIIIFSNYKKNQVDCQINDGTVQIVNKYNKIFNESNLIKSKNEIKECMLMLKKLFDELHEANYETKYELIDLRIKLSTLFHIRMSDRL